MKTPGRNAARWLRQAEYDLRQAEQLLAGGVFSYAAFFAEQAAQKALKAYLLSRGRRMVAIHSVGELAREAAALDSRFASLIEPGGRLDRYYLTSRYPDALPEPAIPAEVYTRQDAEEAVRISRTAVDSVRDAMSA